MLPTHGLRTHAWNTALRSLLLLAGFPVLLAMMGYALALVLVAAEVGSVGEGMRQAGLLMPAILPIALVLALLWFAIAWRAHGRILELVTGARRVGGPQQEPRLWHLAEALCISRGMTMPRLAIIETPARNAFAAGVRRDGGAVVVTRGLMEALDDRELSAVLAHELSHIRNGDARLGVVAAVFVGVITLVTDPVWQLLKASWRASRSTGGSRSSHRSSSSRSSSGGRGGTAGVMVALIAIAIVIATLAHMLAIVLRMALSRSRETLADAGAVEMTQDPDAMISALRKVAQRPDLPRIPEQVRALFLHDSALARGPRLFATHPPLEERVAQLVRYAGGHDPGPLPALPEEPVEEVSEPEAPEAPGPRTEFQERMDALAAFMSTNDARYMRDYAKRRKARRRGLDPDTVAPPPPRPGAAGQVP